MERYHSPQPVVLLSGPHQETGEGSLEQELSARAARPHQVGIIFLSMFIHPDNKGMGRNEVRKVKYK